MQTLGVPPPCSRPRGRAEPHFHVEAVDLRGLSLRPGPRDVDLQDCVQRRKGPERLAEQPAEAGGATVLDDAAGGRCPCADARLERGVDRGRRAAAIGADRMGDGRGRVGVLGPVEAVESGGLAPVGVAAGGANDRAAGRGVLPGERRAPCVHDLVAGRAGQRRESAAARGKAVTCCLSVQPRLRRRSRRRLELRAGREASPFVGAPSGAAAAPRSSARRVRRSGLRVARGVPLASLVSWNCRCVAAAHSASVSGRPSSTQQRRHRGDCSRRLPLPTGFGMTGASRAGPLAATLAALAGALATTAGDAPAPALAAAAARMHSECSSAPQGPPARSWPPRSTSGSSVAPHPRQWHSPVFGAPAHHEGPVGVPWSRKHACDVAPLRRRTVSSTVAADRSTADHRARDFSFGCRRFARRSIAARSASSTMPSSQPFSHSSSP